jgi:hypothetical protein
VCVCVRVCVCACACLLAGTVPDGVSSAGGHWGEQPGDVHQAAVIHRTLLFIGTFGRRYRWLDVVGPLVVR